MYVCMYVCMYVRAFPSSPDAPWHINVFVNTSHCFFPFFFSCFFDRAPGFFLVNRNIDGKKKKKNLGEK